MDNRWADALGVTHGDTHFFIDELRKKKNRPVTVRATDRFLLFSLELLRLAHEQLAGHHHDNAILREQL